LVVSVPRLRAWEGYSLSATLAPSFVRALFAERGGVYVKIAGRCRGASLWQEGEEVVGEGCGEEELRYWSGLWLDRRLAEERAPLLAAAHRELGLSVSPYDRHLVFVAVFLSRATSWEGNVLRWCRGIFSRADTLEELLELDFGRLGGSFQLKQLGPALREYAEKAYGLSDPWEARKALLRVRNVGPKLADAYLLFTGLDPSAAPVDRHALRMAARLGLAGGPPRKELCARYRCAECPAAPSCLRSILSRVYGPVAGWVQTAFYAHDTLFCARELCGSCPLSGVCRARAPPKGGAPKR
jgi:endonuclease III